LVGLASYLLINFWFRRIEANKSAFKAVVYNRFGDLALILALLIIFKVFKSFDFEIINATLHIAEILDNFNLFLIGLLLIIAAMAKSAQIGLHGWLPDAMEGRHKNYSLKYPSEPYEVLTFQTNLTLVKNYSTLSATGPKTNKIIPSDFQKKVITGLLLSDGCLRNPNSHKRKTGNYRLHFTFKASVYDFICWLAYGKFDVLKDICTDTKPRPYPSFNPSQYSFDSRNLPFFTELHKIWYSYNELSNKYLKIVPNNEFLSLYFNEVSLAHCIMGDGYYDNSNKTIVICTECFTYDDVIRLINLLEEKYGLIATAQKRKLKNGVGYRIRFSSKVDNLDNLRKLIKPHMHPLMLYKLG